MRRPLRTILTLALLTLAGCAARQDAAVAERDAVRAVAHHLDRDASQFAVFSGAELTAMLESTLTAWERQLWEHKNIAPDDKADLQKSSAEARLLLRLTGLDLLKGVGFSSRQLPAATPPGRSFIHTELFLALPPETPCALNGFFAKDNSLDLRRELAELPRAAAWAVIADLRPDAMTETLKQAGAWGENLVLELDDLWPSLEGSAGVWKLVTIPLGEKEPDYLLQFPDAENIFGKLPEAERNKLAGDGTIAVKNGRVTICSSPRLRDLLATEGLPKLADDPEFAKWFEAMPKKGVLVFYQNSRTSLTDDTFGTRFAAARPRPALIAAARAEDGLRIAANSGCGLTELLLRCHLATALADAVALPKMEGDPSSDEAADCGCESALKLLWECPKKSATPGAAGLTECFDGKLPPQWAKDGTTPVYFGKSDRPDVPLAISPPARHDDGFHVLFNDGTIRIYKLEKPNSCRRIVGFLQTEKRWDEKLWLQLMKIAEKLDAESAK